MATYGPGALCCPRTVRLLPRYLALVHERSRQRSVPATREGRTARAAPALPLPLAAAFAVDNRVVAEASGAPAAGPHAMSLRVRRHGVRDIGPRRAVRLPGVPGRSMRRQPFGRRRPPSRPGPRPDAVGPRCEDVPVSAWTLDRVHRRRLATQRLSSGGLAHGADVVRLLGCVQSQDAPLGAWSVGLRMPAGTTYADVLAEQAAGGWVRTHVLRPTWHLIAPEDLRWVQAITAAKV